MWLEREEGIAENCTNQLVYEDLLAGEDTGGETAENYDLPLIHEHKIAPV